MSLFMLIEMISTLFNQHSTPLPIQVLTKGLVFMIHSNFYNVFMTLFVHDLELNWFFRGEKKKILCSILSRR